MDVSVCPNHTAGRSHGLWAITAGNTAIISESCRLLAEGRLPLLRGGIFGKVESNEA